MQTSAHPMTTYSQSDFEKIINQGICWQIPDEILHVIKDLEARCQARALKQARNYETHHRRFVGSSGGAQPRRGIPTVPVAAAQQATSVAAWKPSGSAGTDLAGAGPGPGAATAAATTRKKIRQNIKVALNKLSRPNYEKLKGEILAEFAQAAAVPPEGEADASPPEDFLKTLLQEVFAIMGKTREAAMSALYAELWQELNGPQAAEVVEAELLKYRNDVFAVKVLNPETDNDAFCEYQKAVSERRGRAAFLTNLVCRGVVCREAGVAILQYLVDAVEAGVANVAQNRKAHVEEGVEHILLIVHTGLAMWTADATWPGIRDRLVDLSRVVIAERPNMTNRVKFKLQDLLAGVAAP